MDSWRPPFSHVACLAQAVLDRVSAMSKRANRDRSDDADDSLRLICFQRDAAMFVIEAILSEKLDLICSVAAGGDPTEEQIFYKAEKWIAASEEKEKEKSGKKEVCVVDREMN